MLAYRSDLKALETFLQNKSISLNKASEQELIEYLAYRAKQGIQTRSSARILSCMRRFYRYQLREKKILIDPTLTIMSPKLGRTLPKDLTEEEVEALLAAPNTNEAQGLRDKCMLEVLYATGLRVSELITLTLDNINLRQGVIRVLGKGEKERLIPLGEVAEDWMKRYLDNGRKEFLNPSNISNAALFLSKQASMMTRQTFWHRIKFYAKVAGIQKNLSPHTIRHAFATHLVNHGADLRVVQLLLGHSNISTTQIYIHVANNRLQSLHQKHHPRG